MSATGKSLAKRGIKVGVAVAGVASTAAQSVVRGAAEADQEEERFVPSRVVLPVRSLALALVAAPLELPPLLGVNHQAITARRSRADFTAWIQTLDPEGHTWTYCPATRTYRQSLA